METVGMMLEMLDPEFRETTIRSVSKEGDGWTLDLVGFSFHISHVDGLEPKAGMTARFYGRGVGYPVRGVTLDGKVVFYRTEEEQDALRAQWIADEKAKKRKYFEENKTALDARIEALPPEFVKRIVGFIDRRPDFRYEMLPYELFVCEQAVVFARALGSAEAVKEFHAMPYESQRIRVPEMGNDHSGNTFGAACQLANLFLTEPALVPKSHGALCPMVGCQEYGCWSTTQPEKWA